MTNVIFPEAKQEFPTYYGQEKIMEHTSVMTELRKEYLMGKCTKKELEGSIFQYLLNNYAKYHLYRGSREDWNDLLADLYPRISRAIDTYKDVGSSFDTYIHTMIHWAYKDHQNRRTSHQVTEYTWWRARAEESMAGSPETEYNTGVQEISSGMESRKPETAFYYARQELINGKFSAKQILILFLKSYYFINDKIVTQVSASLGIKKEKLLDMVDKLRMIRKKREDEIKEIEAGIESQYYRCIVYQKRLMYSIQGSSSHGKLNVLLERARRRFKLMRKRLKGIRFDATNCQIAEILNIPKGTVDSTLDSIKRKSKKMGFQWERPLYSKEN